MPLTFFLFLVIWEKVTPREAIIIPSHCMGVSSSLPRIIPDRAVMTGIKACITDDLATPRCLMELTHRVKHTQEHRMARQKIGLHTSQDR